VSLVGAEILGDQQRTIFEMAKILREYYLLQDSYHPIDRYCASEKSYHMLRLIMKFSTRAREAVESGVTLADLLTLEVREDLERMKIIRSEDFGDVHSTIEQKIDEQFNHLLRRAKEAS
jgi:V/A-type H+-transporting ATPase subunit A